jgi:hypothetical protein
MIYQYLFNCGNITFMEKVITLLNKKIDSSKMLKVSKMGTRVQSSNYAHLNCLADKIKLSMVLYNITTLNTS